MLLKYFFLFIFLSSCTKARNTHSCCIEDKINLLDDLLDLSSEENFFDEIDENLLFDAIISDDLEIDKISEVKTKIKPNAWPQFVPANQNPTNPPKNQRTKIGAEKSYNPQSIYEKCGRINPRRDCWDKSFTSSCYRPSRKGRQFYLHCGVFTVNGEVRKCPDYTFWNQKILSCDYR